MIDRTALAFAILVTTSFPAFSFGSNVDKQNEYPSVVWVCVKTAKGKGCGTGVVVGANVVLTAGHGGIKIKRPDDALTVIVGKRTFYAERVIVHPDYPSASAARDKAREAYLKLPAKLRENMKDNFSRLSDSEKAIVVNTGSATGRMESVDIAIVHVKAPSGLGVSALKIVLPALDESTDKNALNLANELNFDIKKSIEVVGAGYGNANCKYDHNLDKWKPCATSEGVRRWDTVKARVIRPEFNAAPGTPVTAFLIELTTDSGVSPNHPGDSGGALLLKYSDGTKNFIGLMVGGNGKTARAITFLNPAVARFLHENLPQIVVLPKPIVKPATPIIVSPVRSGP